MFKLVRRVVVGAVLVMAAVASGAFFILRASLPERNVVYTMEGLQASVDVQFDEYGIPRIHAQTREDAFRALGFVTAQERLFQMDLLRRRSGGRLAGILGSSLLGSDRWHRIMGFEQVAAAIVARLPDNQKVILNAYVGGINQAMERMTVLPFGFLVLGYRPEPWRIEDSLLVVLGMFETLTWRRGDKERMATVMEAALGPKILAFFTPASDRYADSISGNSIARRPPQPLPREELAALCCLSALNIKQDWLGNPASLRVLMDGWWVWPRLGMGGQYWRTTCICSCGCPIFGIARKCMSWEPCCQESPSRGYHCLSPVPIVILLGDLPVWRAISWILFYSMWIEKTRSFTGLLPALPGSACTRRRFALKGGLISPSTFAPPVGDPYYLTRCWANR